MARTDVSGIKQVYWTLVFRKYNEKLIDWNSVYHIDPEGARDNSCAFYKIDNYWKIAIL